MRNRCRASHVYDVVQKVLLSCVKMSRYSAFESVDGGAEGHDDGDVGGEGVAGRRT